jgi:hypothetical protein
MHITEGPRANLGCSVGLINITEGSRTMLGSPVSYMDITKGYKDQLGCPVWYIDITEGSKSMLGYTEQPNLALESSVISMYTTGHLSLAKEPSVMPHCMSVLIIGPKKPCHGQVSLLVPHDVPDPLMSKFLSMSPISTLATSERSLCFSVHLMVSQNILKMWIFSFWISLKLEQIFILAHFLMR